MIEVHRFDDCPPEWQALSDNGGDEDWLVTLSPSETDEAHEPRREGVSMIEHAEYLAERLDTCWDPQEVTLPDGRPAWITSHA